MYKKQRKLSFNLFLEYNAKSRSRINKWEKRKTVDENKTEENFLERYRLYWSYMLKSIE